MSKRAVAPLAALPRAGKIRRRRHYRSVTHRKLRFNAAMDKCGKRLLQMADEMWQQADGLDTAVRDNIAEGLGRIVMAGYDCLASNLSLDTDGWMSFIDHSTADWFRNRGFAEWFCIAAANGFNKSRPRVLSEMITFRKPARRNRRAATKEQA